MARCRSGIFFYEVLILPSVKYRADVICQTPPVSSYQSKSRAQIMIDETNKHFCKFKPDFFCCFFHIFLFLLGPSGSSAHYCSKGDREHDQTVTCTDLQVQPDCIWKIYMILFFLQMNVELHVLLWPLN